jgi:hypothetical protein
MASNALMDLRSSFRYNTSAVWFKGNTHVHSIASDGGKTFEELAAMYSDVGYDFLYRTDHWVVSDVSSDEADYPLLWLDGIELDGADSCGSQYHVLCLGTFSGITQEMGLCAAMDAARAQDGLLVLAHPHSTGNTSEEALRWKFDGVEVYNEVCQYVNGKGNGNVYWHAALERSSDVLGLAADDAHVRPEYPTWNGGWIVVNAPELTRPTIESAVRAGNFYSSCGPEFESIELDSREVVIRCSPVRCVRLVGPRGAGRHIGTPDGSLISDARLEIPSEWAYALLEIEDDNGRRAWTNSLFAHRDRP